MKTRIALFVVIAGAGILTAGPVRAQQCIPSQECGDVNNSGNVSATDASTVLTRAVGLPATLTCNCEPGEPAIVSQPVQTGQATCHGTDGGTIDCAGTGQDGEIQAGSSRSFTDNLDGTVTDNATGLMWEKHGGDGSIHDASNAYTWTDAVAVKIAELNATSFAGHDDWRLPNRFELETLLNLGAMSPATYRFPQLVAACSAQLCSCTRISLLVFSTYLPTGCALRQLQRRRRA
jgi:hypothetical protein